MQGFRFYLAFCALPIVTTAAAAEGISVSFASRPSRSGEMIMGEGALNSQSVRRVEKLRDAISGQNLEDMLACFSERFTSEMPVHPERNFTGKEQMRKNWSAIFASVPDIRATLLTIAADDGVVIAEWAWDGHRIDGTTFAMRGVTVQKVEDDLIVWTRLYMEPLKP